MSAPKKTIVLKPFFAPLSLGRFFRANALDRKADARVVFRRVGTALKFRGVLDPFLGTWVVGLFAGAAAWCCSGSEGAASETAEWFFRNATEVNVYFAFGAIGLASYLVATHAPLHEQWYFRRTVALPLLRVVGDAFLLASGAFVVVLIATLPHGSVVVGMGQSATVLSKQAYPGGFVTFTLLALFTCLARLIADSFADVPLFKDVNGKDPAFVAHSGWLAAVGASCS